MSLMHYFMNGMLDDMSHHYFDPSFGLGMPVRLMRQTSRQNKALSKIINDKEAFKINLDVRQFTPEELTVKIVEDYLVVEGKHEERDDEHGPVSRQFVRRYLLPGKVDKSAVIANLSSDGILQIYAPKLPSDEEDEKEIPITQTNIPAIEPEAEENQEEEQKDE